jgi:hypothetical protein
MRSRIPPIDNAARSRHRPRGTHDLAATNTNSANTARWTPLQQHVARRRRRRPRAGTDWGREARPSGVIQRDGDVHAKGNETGQNGAREPKSVNRPAEYLPFAIQNVEGSSPFIRSRKGPQKRGVSHPHASERADREARDARKGRTSAVSSSSPPTSAVAGAKRERDLRARCVSAGRASGLCPLCGWEEIP